MLNSEQLRMKRFVKEQRRKQERKACRLLGGFRSPVWQNFKQQVREFVLQKEERERAHKNAS